MKTAAEKINVRKTPCALHPYTARIKGFVTYGYGSTAKEARECLVRRLAETGERREGFKTVFNRGA